MVHIKMFTEMKWHVEYRLCKDETCKNNCNEFKHSYLLLFIITWQTVTVATNLLYTVSKKWPLNLCITKTCCKQSTQFYWNKLAEVHIYVDWYCHRYSYPAEPTCIATTMLHYKIEQSVATLQFNQCHKLFKKDQTAP